jgi:hypothetical protein
MQKHPGGRASSYSARPLLYKRLILLSKFALRFSLLCSILTNLRHLRYDDAQHPRRGRRMELRQILGIAIGALLGAFLGVVVGSITIGPGFGGYVGIADGAAIGVVLGGAFSR